MSTRESTRTVRPGSRLALLLAAAIAVGAPAIAGVTTAAAADPALGVTVTKTNTSPGYEATFRYQAPAGVTSVQIAGEWTFDQPSDITVLNNQSVVFGQDWRPGMVIAGTMNAWKNQPMTLGTDGIWTFTQPLPAGTYSYGFYWDCTDPLGAGCTRHADPANLPWSNQPAAVAAGASQQTLSQVYIPANPAFPTYDNAYQAPTTIGTLADMAYPSPTPTDPAATRPLAVYLPVGYDPKRATPYPVLYLCHGGSGSETDWFTQGIAQYIEENAIRDGVTQPFVMVSTNYNGFTTYESYAQEVLTHVIPYAEAHYNISKDPSGRAFAGLSAGGRFGLTLLYDHSSAFAYYGLWSAAIGYTVPTATQLAGMLAVPGGIQMGWGNQDWLGSPQWGVIGGSACDPANPACTTVNQINADRVAGLTGLGVPIDAQPMQGIHSWDIWRTQLRYFIANTLFKTTTVAVTPQAQTGSAAKLTAVVTPVTTNNVRPAGRVSFYAGQISNGSLLGSAPVGADGKATLTLKLNTVGDMTVVAVYQGDKLYTRSFAGPTVVKVTAGPVVETGGSVAGGPGPLAPLAGLALLAAGLATARWRLSRG